MTLKTVLYRHRLLAKQVIALLARILPAPASRQLRALVERVAFSVTSQYQGETLPPIFHYWSGRYVAPEAERLGFGSAEVLYFDHIVQQAAQSIAPVRVLSVGCGAASMEIQLAGRLRENGTQAHITCIDFNPTLMRNAGDAAHTSGVAELITFEVRDCNQPFTLPPQDVIIVNQFFHHVTELETFCASLQRSMAPAGALLSSDIIGRNGHQLWPATEAEVQRFWLTLPPTQRHDRHFGTVQQHYRPIDHAAYSNEGVRAQDVVSCLLAAFDFELFYSFGGAIVPFVERRIGFNFDPDNVDDRALIDRVQAADATALREGRYPAANMVAVLRHHGRVVQATHVPVSPQRHAELTRQQQASLPVGRRQMQQ